MPLCLQPMHVLPHLITAGRSSRGVSASGESAPDLLTQLLPEDGSLEVDFVERGDIARTGSIQEAEEKTSAPTAKTGFFGAVFLLVRWVEGK